MKHWKNLPDQLCEVEARVLLEGGKDHLVKLLKESIKRAHAKEWSLGVLLFQQKKKSTLIGLLAQNNKSIITAFQRKLCKMSVFE